jgi:hypothetical protein
MMDCGRTVGFGSSRETPPASEGRAKRWKEGGTDERRGGIVDYSDPLEPGGLASGYQMIDLLKCLVEVA